MILKIHFRKGIYEGYPNRWYLNPDNNIHTIAMFTFRRQINSDMINYSAIDELEKNGFNPQIQHVSIGENWKMLVYLEFDDPTDEAPFMLWASGGMDVDIEV